MQVYSAYRGFCSQVWRRSNRQVWPWELDALEDENAEVGDTMGRSDIIGCEPKPQVRVLEQLFLPGEVRPLSNLGAIENIDSTCKVNIRVSENSTSASQTSLDNSGDYDLPSQTSDSCNVIAREFVPVSDNSSLGGKLGTIARPCCMRHDILTAKGHKLPIHMQRKISPFAFESGRDGETGFDKATVTKPPRHSASAQFLCPLTSSMVISNPKTMKHETHVPPRRKGHMKIHVFGPERLVEDPRIRKVYKDIKRKILVMGGIVSVLWVVVCLVVPCAASP